MTDNKDKVFEITSKKQDNGLWGIPMQCRKIDKWPSNLSEDVLLKHSAICIGISEKYKDETFEIFWSDENGFFVKLSKSGMRKIKYNDYKLEGNVLMWNRQSTRSRGW